MTDDDEPPAGEETGEPTAPDETVPAARGRSLRPEEASPRQEPTRDFPGEGTQHEPTAGELDHRLSWLAVSGSIEYSRIVFFSDAVFAIAITLLAVTLHVPNASHLLHPLSVGQELDRARSSLLGFVISFAAIALFWLAHHSMFRYIRAIDRTLTAINLLFLGVIAFLPYPTEVLSTAPSKGAGATIFYALCAGTAGLLESFLWIYATRPGSPLVYPLPSRVRQHYTLRAIRAPFVFFLSIPIALINPQAGEYSWLLIWVLSVLINRVTHAREALESGEPDARRYSGHSPLSQLRRSTRR